MSDELLITSVDVRRGRIFVVFNDGRALSGSLRWFPRLARATHEQQKNYRLIAGGHGVHWPNIDEDLSAEGLLKACSRTPEQQALYENVPPPGYDLDRHEDWGWSWSRSSSQIAKTGFGSRRSACLDAWSHFEVSGPGTRT